MPVNVETQGLRLAALQHQASRLTRALKEVAERLNDEASRLDSRHAQLQKQQQENELAIARQRQEMLADIAAQSKHLDDQKRVISEIKEAQESRITLNVGGCAFETTRATLQRWPGSMLEVMFSGRHALHPSEDGSFFIDRDGACFAHVLEYMRLGDKTAPQFDGLEQELKDRLWAEADYFGLPGLCDLLLGCGYARALTREDARMRADEDEKRLAFCSASSAGSTSAGSSKAAAVAPPTDAIHQYVLDLNAPLNAQMVSDHFRGSVTKAHAEKHLSALAEAGKIMFKENGVLGGKKSKIFWASAADLLLAGTSVRSWSLTTGLVKLFSAAEGLVRESSDANYTLLFEEYAKTLGTPTPMGERPIVASEAEFLSRFDRRHRDVLSRLRDVRRSGTTGWLVAGGSVLRALLPRTPDSWSDDSDVDIFIYSRAGQFESDVAKTRHATELAKCIFDALTQTGESWHVTRSRFVINMSRCVTPWNSEPPVQIVLRLYDSPAEVLLGFDVDCCCVGYDGKHVYALPRALRALRHGYVVCNPLHSWPNEPTYELRLAKYASRGFAVAVPGLNLERVDLLRATTEAALPKLRGVARLLLLHAELQMRLKQSTQTGQPMPSLRSLYGEFCLFSGYGPGAHDQTRTLPTDEDEDRLLSSWWMRSNLSPDDASPEEAGDEGPPPHCNASLVVNPYAELEMDQFDPPPMTLIQREELWDVIRDAGRDSLLIPRRLTWSTEPRSREYLNAKELNLDHAYFASAYPPYGEEGERLARARNPFMSPRRPLPSRAAEAEEADPSTAQELARTAGPSAVQEDAFPAFADVAEALRAAATGTVVGGAEPDDDL